MKYLKESQIIKGSLQERRLPCGNLGCHCHKKRGIGHGPYVYLAIVLDGRTQPLLLKKEDVPVVRKYVKRYSVLKKEVEAITRKNVAMLKKGRLS